MALSLTYFIIILLAVIMGDILCADITNSRQPVNPWQLGNNKNTAINEPRQNSNAKSTTPWPVLGHRRVQHQDNTQQSAFQANNNQHYRQPMWVRPNNGTSWVRNTHSAPTPVPSQNIGGAGNTNGRGNVQNVKGSNVAKPAVGNSPNFNTNFLNKERGRVGVSSIRRQGNVNNDMGVVISTGSKGGVVKNQQQNPPVNRMGGGVSSGSMLGGPGATQNRNRESDGDNQDLNLGEVTDNELREFSEELLDKDINNAARHVAVNLQGMTSSRSTSDAAPLPLLSINQAAFSIPSIEKLMRLYNNYILEVKENEVYTAQEKLEENDLLDTILSTPVMQYARNFLIKKGKLGKDPKEFKDLLRLIWFNMYSRGGGRIGSSGFEHVFLAELKNNQVSGLHNWIYFNEEERKNNANYLGYMKKLDLGNKGAILKYHFTFHNVDKPVGSMFIGTSPELEMALYSTCFVLRADRICPLKMNGNRFIIRTYTYKYRGKNTIGSAFPEI